LKYTNLVVEIDLFAFFTALSFGEVVSSWGIFGITTKGFSTEDAIARGLDTSGNGWIGW